MGVSAASTAQEVKAMNNIDQISPVCGKNRIPREWRATTFEYTDNGVTVRGPNVYAWVCPEDGEIAYPPDTVDELIDTVRELIEVANRARQRKSILMEYLVTVG